ncbi:zinc ion binding [Striga asiatica]|uniref:Zinc ion binding n=1 Tax=Striga asiatica TaxID=4170 RepID=A0A5A7Q7A7_STRAF|nr:zinc ion binding [Striga asiatica]
MSSCLQGSSSNILCLCGFPAKLRASKTSSNPGRKFYGCRDWRPNGAGGCPFFSWYDTTEIGKMEAEGKITSVKLESEIGSLKEKMARLELLEEETKIMKQKYEIELKKLNRRIWRLELLVSLTFVYVLISYFMK